MSFECNVCHVAATMQTHQQAGHFMLSRGRCETCHVAEDCADCHCEGDWATAYRNAETAMQKQQRGDLVDILRDTERATPDSPG